MIGLSATDDVSLNGSPTVSPTTVAACSSVPFSRSSVSTIFFALSHAPPALAMKIAWNSPVIARPIRYPMKNGGGANAAAGGVEKKGREKFDMAARADFLQISTPGLLS